MSQQTAAKQISELESAGLVSRMRSGRYTFCELSEPLMRVCIEVKDNRTRHFRLFVEFLRHWFTARELERRQAAFDQLLPTDNGNSLPVAALRVRSVGHRASARRHLDRTAELRPEDRELWIERVSLHIHEGAYDAAIESAAKVEALPGSSLLGRLLAAQATAGTQPLQVALDTLGPVIAPEDFESDEPAHIKAIAGILTVSARNFGPRHFSEGLVKLRDLLTDLLDRGVVGAIVAGFLIENVEDGLSGSLADWEKAMAELASSLAELSDCCIPMEMLRVAVRFTKTGDEKHLLSLPFEKRQLLEEILPPSAGEPATSRN